jgi:glycosyltransferase involved in cell wall biosynthesis
MRTSVLVVSAEPVAARMAGPAIRAAELARVLASECDVTLAAPAPSVAPDARLRLLEAGMADVEALARAAAEHDVVVAQELPPTVLARVARGPARFVADLYNPIVVEALEAVAGGSPRRRRLMQARLARRTLAQLAAADLVLCANERQRDLWIGALAVSGLLDVDAYRRDPTLRSLVAVVPFGLPADPPPAPDRAVLREAFPALGEDARVLVWGGGLWSWLDPLTPMRAAAQLADRDVHLVLMGAGRPGIGATGQLPAVERALAEARRIENVHMTPDWVPYAERGRWLAAADLGVSAHRDHLEARFAHRTRLLDYLWAGLPVVTTAGDALAGLVAREGLGRTPAPEDPAAFADACAELLGDAGAAARERVAAIVPSLRWDVVAAPLVEWCATAADRPRRAVARGALRRATFAGYRLAFAETLADDGPAAAARRVGRRLRRVGTLR